MQKYLKADFNTVIVAEPDCEEILKTWGLAATTYHYIEPWPDGYMFAMYQKTIADTYTDADLIMLLDSDHMLLRPAGLDEFMAEGKPVIRYREWTEDPNDSSLIEGKRQWAPPTERVLGIPLDRDYMRGPPFLFWRDTFTGVRERIEDVTGLPFHDAIYSDRPHDYRNFLAHPKTYCDYEVLGLYAAKFQPDRYSLVHQPPDEHWPFRVFWSHGDWGQPVATQLDNLLHVPEPFDGDPFVQPELFKLISKHHVTKIVETGTHRGDSTRVLSLMAPVITIELDKKLFDQVPEMPNVTRLQGYSAGHLDMLMPKMPEPVLFYLDAHGQGVHSPLLEELQAIRHCQKKPVIVIHDFKNPDRPDYGYDTWDIGPYSIELIEPVLKEIYPDGYTYHFNEQAAGHRRGLIYIEPE